MLYKGSLPGRVFGLWRTGHLTWVISRDQAFELARVLAYPRIERRLGWGVRGRRRFLGKLVRMAEVVDIRPSPGLVPGDDTDSVILATLRDARAACLITGDRHLLDLAETWPIVRPAEFLAMIDSAAGNR